MSPAPWKSLTEEKTLWHVFRLSWQIPGTTFNKWATLVAFIFFSVETAVSGANLWSNVAYVRKLADSGLTLALSTLGFIVAGYTIFATLTSPDLSIAMQKHIDRVSKLPTLKKNHFIFLRVFVYYLVFAFLCLILIVVGRSKGLGSILLSESIWSGDAREFLVKSSIVILNTSLFFLLVQLKSFIFNVYASVMTSLRWNAIEKGISEEDVPLDE